MFYLAMKRLITILLLCFSGVTVFAQKPLTILSKEITAGKNLITNADIKAIEHVFPQRIDNYYLDTLTNLLTLQLRGISESGNWIKSTGKIVLYDLTNREEKWNKKINYLKSNILQYDDVLVQIQENTTSRLNIETGENQWQVTNSILYTDQFTGIGIGYPLAFSSANAKRLEGINLSYGNLAWFREVSREYGWNDVIHLNDSVILLVAAGLHTINPKTGAGWDYSTITGAKDYTGVIIGNTMGIALGLLTGTFMTFTEPDVVTDIASNVWMDSTNLYFASREKIAGLDMDGKTLWFYPFPKHKASKSSIFSKDSLIYMVNFGFAFLGNRQIDFGNPFIAAFNKHNGRQVFLTEINENKEQIADYILGDNEILLLFKNKVAKYSMNDGALIFEKAISTETTGDLKNFTGEQLYVATDSVYQSLISIGPDKLFLVTANNKMLTMNGEFEIQDITDLEKVYSCYLWTNDLKFLARNKETIVIDYENKRIAEIEASSKSFMVGAKLYDIKDKSFLEFDLSGLLESMPGIMK
jgi:hypothetical protein